MRERETDRQMSWIPAYFNFSSWENLAGYTISSTTLYEGTQVLISTQNSNVISDVFFSASFFQSQQNGENWWIHSPNRSSRKSVCWALPKTQGLQRRPGDWCSPVHWAHILARNNLDTFHWRHQSIIIQSTHRSPYCTLAVGQDLNPPLLMNPYLLPSMHSPLFIPQYLSLSASLPISHCWTPKKAYGSTTHLEYNIQSKLYSDQSSNYKIQESRKLSLKKKKRCTGNQWARSALTAAYWVLGIRDTPSD
jgi:hypothetical protein